MFNNFYCHMIFYPLMMISSMLIFITNSWFSMWLIMELNLISFLTLMIFNKNLKNNLMMNYLIIQSFNSYMFLMFSMLNFLNKNLMFILFMYFSIINKIGMPPFYMWYLKIMKYLNWTNLFFMSSIQKIIPLIILINILNIENMNFINMIYLIFSSLYSSIKGMNFTNLKMILTYSSMIQISWMILLSNNNELTTMNYLIIYTLIMFNLTTLFNKINIINLNNLSNLKFKFKNYLFLLTTLIFSIGSIPPTFGFLMKWISIYSLMFNLNYLILFMMIINSLISTYFYIRLMFFSLMFYSISNKNNFKFINFNLKLNNQLIFFNWMMLMLILIYEIF